MIINPETQAHLFAGKSAHGAFLFEAIWAKHSLTITEMYYGDPVCGDECLLVGGSMKCTIVMKNTQSLFTIATSYP